MYRFVGFILTITFIGPYGNILICWFYSYDYTYRTICVDINWLLLFLRQHLSDHIGICQVVVFILTTTLIGPYGNISIRVFSYDKTSKYRISLVWLKNSFTHCSISGDDWPHWKLSPLQLIMGHSDSESHEMTLKAELFYVSFI